MHVCMRVSLCVEALDVIVLQQADNNALLADRKEEPNHECIKRSLAQLS